MPYRSITNALKHLLNMTIFRTVLYKSCVIDSISLEMPENLWGESFFVDILSLRFNHRKHIAMTKIIGIISHMIPLREDI